MATKKKVSSASKARREAARVKDAELSATAIAMLESPHIGERIAHLVTTPRLLTYSLRNQALLLGQADERGMTLTDVDTYRGWQRRSRHVRPGEHGLKIVRPVRPSESITDHTDRAGDQTEPDTDIKFRTITVFDRTQTDELEHPHFGEHNSHESRNRPAAQTDAEADEETAAMPEAVLLESLREQAERAGYLSVILPANHTRTGSVDVDHQGRTIIVYNDGDTQTLAQFASTVATIIASLAKRKAQALN
jgi:hypothetical protein